ncbi:ABC transporter substrate-binding protein [Adhaeribacter radiodurans]|uniref:ABC transporter substrate-binding protein n=2 Tax=Adhaeribacter radiodurans TaxID=2745197 RepID=A0A7L7LFC8_9BACT|nr:ABC transporter substrate-binding protein [Adhaeribacter radiodurans]
MGFEVKIPGLPQRIISLVPSQTELLFDLGLKDKIVGITKFCVHPAQKIKSKSIIGGTKNFHFDVIDSLKPDLIIGNKEENYQAGVLQLKEKYPVWMSDISNLTTALSMIQQIGVLTSTQNKSQNITQKISDSFQKLNSNLNVPTAYFIWREPFMSVGQNTFIQDMLVKCGFRNVFASQYRYPEITADQLLKAQPELILLSSEPYPFQEKHIREFQELCPNALVKLVDGEVFSWYGSRLLYSAAYFKKLVEEVKNELNHRN